MKIRNQFNYKWDEALVYETNGDGISQTVPDQSLTIPELVDRYTRGMQVQTFKPVWYPEDEINEFEGEFDKLDKLERIDLARDVKKEIEENRKVAAEKLKNIVTERKKKAALDKANRIEKSREKTQVKIPKDYNNIDPNAGEPASD